VDDRLTAPVVEPAVGDGLPAGLTTAGGLHIADSASVPEWDVGGTIAQVPETWGQADGGGV
jgi:hypothetical protein